MIVVVCFWGVGVGGWGGGLPGCVSCVSAGLRGLLGVAKLYGQCCFAIDFWNFLDFLGGFSALSVLEILCLLLRNLEFETAYFIDLGDVVNDQHLRT